MLSINTLLPSYTCWRCHCLFLHDFSRIESVNMSTAPLDTFHETRSREITFSSARNSPSVFCTTVLLPALRSGGITKPGPDSCRMFRMWYSIASNLRYAARGRVPSMHVAGITLCRPVDCSDDSPTPSEVVPCVPPPSEELFSCVAFPASAIAVALANREAMLGLPALLAK